MEQFIRLLGESFRQWRVDRAARLAAALSFYAMLSIAPLLAIVLTLAGLVLGNSAAQQGLIDQTNGWVAGPNTDVLKTVLKNTAPPDVRSLAGLFAIVTLAWAASNFFAQLHEALNLIWNVKLKPGLSIWVMLRRRLVSFVLVGAIGVLLLVSLFLNASLDVFGPQFVSQLPGGTLVWDDLNLILSLGVTTLLFAMMYRTIPDVHIAWRDVWQGAFVTAILVSLGNQVLSFYLGRMNIASVYGAAGSLVLLLLWVYFSIQIVFFGAEFTHVYAILYGQGMTPAKNACYIDEELAPKLQQTTVRPRILH